MDLPKPVADAIRYPAATVEHIRHLAQTLSDPQIVARLNHDGQRSPHDRPFTLAMVKWVRYKYAIAHKSSKSSDELSVMDVAKRFGISADVVYYWIGRGIIEPRQPEGSGRLWIKLDAAKEQELRERVLTSSRIQKQHANI